MRRRPHLIVLVLAVLLLAACGFKGDLVQPGDDSQPGKQEPANAPATAD